MDKRVCDGIRGYWYQYGYFVFIIIAVLIKQMLACGVPIWARDSGGADEYLMLSQAENLVKGEYLGAYDQFTLVKGMMFPLFLAVCNWIGMSYLNAITLLYSIASLVAVHVFGYFTENKITQYTFFIMVLFCPVTYSSNISLVYRDAILPSMAILLICAFMLMYLSLYKSIKRYIGWSIVASIVWFFLCNTREDTIWTKPLVAIVMLILIGTIFVHRKNGKNIVVYIAFTFVPVVFLFVGTQVLSIINYEHYGIYTVNELDDSNYTQAALLIMQIKPEQNVENVTITRNALQQAYFVSPTLSELKDIIENDYDNHNPLTQAGNNPNNGEFDGDYITWELRGAASAKGYYATAQTAEKFWGNVITELEDAFADGELEKRAILPSRSLIPWPGEKDSMKKLGLAFLDLYKSASSYKYCRTSVITTQPTISDEVIKRYEGITGNYALDAPSYNVFITGWVFGTEQTGNCTVGIEDEAGQVLEQSFCSKSEDVYQGFLNNRNLDYENAKNARFTIETSLHNLEGAKLVARDSGGNIIGTVSLEDKSHENWVVASEHAFDTFIIKSQNEPRYAYAKSRINRLNRIGNVYRTINKYLTAVAVVIYLLKTIQCIVSVVKKKQQNITSWIFVSAFAGALLVYMGGLAYVHAFMYPIRGYLSGIYALLQTFTATIFCLLVQEVLHTFRNMVRKII